ncbi:MAG: DNA polymerase III subunit delta [Halioglobus sp.]
MQLRPEQLSRHLEQQLLPIYVVSSDDPLLQQESCDLVRKHARQQGCTDREIIDSKAAGFNWHEILNSAASMSLFSDRKLIELHLPSGKPGADGSKALCEYVELAGEDDVLLIIAGKIDKQSTKSKWFKALDKVGGILQIWPVDAKQLPRWLEQRISSAGMRIDRDALQLLCDKVEGNLLSAVQEVEKLKLLAKDGEINVDTVTDAVADNARYNLFALADNAVLGNTGASLKMLHGLRGEGAEPTVILWALTREIRTLYEIQVACSNGQSEQQALQSQRVWNNKVPQVKAALARHKLASLTALLQQAALTDGSIKGFADGNPWDNLAALITGLSQPDRQPALN